MPSQSDRVESPTHLHSNQKGSRNLTCRKQESKGRAGDPAQHVILSSAETLLYGYVQASARISHWQKAPVRKLTLSRDTLVVVLSYWKKPQTIHRVGRQNFIFNNYCFQRQMLSIRLREELWKLISSIHFTDENIKAQRREMIFPLLLCWLERNEAENPGALVPELGYNPLHTPSTHALHTVPSCPLSTILLLTLSSPPLTSLLKQELKSVSQEPPISNCGSCSPSSIFYHSWQVKPTEVEDTQMVLTHTLQSSPILCSITCGKAKLHGSGLQHCVRMCYSGCPVHPCIGRKIVSRSQQQIICLWLFLNSQF